jgi:hypothetical protein
MYSVSINLFTCRFVNFANPSRTLATQDPDFEDFLPVDDDQFFNAVRYLPFLFSMGERIQPRLT